MLDITQLRKDLDAGRIVIITGFQGIDGDGNIYIKDWWRSQSSTDVWIDMLLDMAARHQVLDWAEEKGQIEKSIGPFIVKRMQERNIFFNRRQFTSTADKPTRAQSFRGRLAQGKVFLPRHAAWRPALEAELLSFNAGKHDDQVDTLSLFGRMLDTMFPPRRDLPSMPEFRSTVPGMGPLG